jgi:LPPG:FO 2-phospho-L-lactate transferase
VSAQNLVYLSGGVGGARLAHGLYQLLDPETLTMIVNTGDDLRHWGLAISPDLDTMMYTLADVADVARGWGLADETFHALSWVQRYGGETWFQLGDRDLATHLMRTQWLHEGRSLTEVTQTLCTRLSVHCRVLPMCDAPCETMLDTDLGTLAFQQWLVGQRGKPRVERVWFRGEARASGAVLSALEAARIVIIGPSNPYVSIDPILMLPGIRERLAGKSVLAVSPIVHGQAVKGPLAEMLRSLSNTDPNPASIARHYGSLLSALIVERGDEIDLGELPVLGADTVMHSRVESRALAQQVLEFAKRLGAWS